MAGSRDDDLNEDTDLNGDDFELLDRYLQSMHESEPIDRMAFLAEHPHLESALECIEALEGLAMPSGLVEDDAQQIEPSAGAAPHDNAASFGSSVTDALPCRFGDYELLEEIGRGGMGVVYRARQVKLDRMVAIKMILSSHLASDQHVSRFLAEAQAAARLQHAHIVHIHEVGEINRQHFFVMEYVEGESLAERLLHGKIEHDEAVRILTKISRAVAYLNREGIVHRDLKPSNILLDREGNPHLTDFGLAKVRTTSPDLTTSGTIIGTPSYMSPEQASGRSVEVGPASDVYSLGAILYEMLTGRPPHREETPLDTLMQVLTGEPMLPRQRDRSIPRSLQTITMKCLMKQPHGRYESADALADDLDHYLRGESLTVRPPSLYERFLRWMRREPALAGRLTAIGVFFCVETVNHWFGGVDDRFHQQMLWIMGGWVVVWIACQQLLKIRSFGLPAHLVWSTLDTLLLLLVLFIADGVASSIVLGLPLLVAASGLWMHERLVWTMTGMSIASYLILVADFYFRRIELQQRMDIDPVRHVIFIVVLFGIGCCVCYLVHRIRTLSRFCGRDDDSMA